MVLLLLLYSASTLAVNIPQDDPKRLVHELSQSLVDAIDANRQKFEENPSEIKRFADENVLPYIDTPKMARYVMAQFWKQASEEQQNAFVEAFTNTLLRSYSTSILKLKVSRMVVLNAIETHKGRVSVATEVTQNDGNVTKVVYRLFLNGDDQKWYLYDVSIEGVSMLLNYRKSYASEFQKKGIDNVIAALQEKNRQSNLIVGEE
ncbi:MAG: toluene tolerance protein [Piscirickettsiaceae bacterium CG_4_9_14_3_um_filter_43_564]|nr:ABC transporter substrate-binding protein [Thiomicrospira sp.]PIQ03743.1 MAG: toluene tolerance protein [Piscirickettsiaceae bacterium CG18_big_fil_WC_8_21_14_2_50_44_103]PIU39083.1 MAG: toluene tolerance protein [Piscirickettsiaceae bacterium CG07_land_8_20_14_0_80_44_28]PIW57046.1 MAG: toluene tolerance protein [Piscirickettsiaceae bacterium CG12_big_fil_rev_8_21_14_0_65_44_934]PIW77906.1 MAG: toluene tolerance protein [Piscirickettsiaceae bacterium CG_4_8_14_3_um_filter_44_38]PIX80929.1 